MFKWFFSGASEPQLRGSGSQLMSVGVTLLLKNNQRVAAGIKAVFHGLFRVCLPASSLNSPVHSLKYTWRHSTMYNMPKPVYFQSYWVQILNLLSQLTCRGWRVQETGEETNNKGICWGRHPFFFFSCCWSKDCSSLKKPLAVRCSWKYILMLDIFFLFYFLVVQFWLCGSVNRSQREESRDLVNTP